MYPSGFEAELPLRSIFEPNAGDGAIDAKTNVRVNAGVEANALFSFSWLRFGIFDADH